MGGFGSGPRGPFKGTTIDLVRIDIRRRPRVLYQGDAAAVVKLIDPEGGVVRAFEVHLSWTPCGWGGERPWFLCPACKRRAAVLYFGAVPACRRCARLVYPSTREDPTDRALRRANELRARLGWPRGIIHGIGGRRRGMHGQTYERLTFEYLAHHQKALQAMREKMRQSCQRAWPDAADAWWLD